MAPLGEFSMSSEIVSLKLRSQAPSPLTVPLSGCGDDRKLPIDQSSVYGHPGAMSSK